MYKITRTIKELDRHLGVIYSNICQPDIMTKTTAKFLDPEMPKITPDTGIYRPKTDAETTYLKKKNLNGDIRQILMKKDGHETDIQKVYNIIVGRTN